MSLVESWPSTEMRSKERLTQTPSSRSAVSGSSAASVCTKQSIVANAGEIIPAPFACALSADGARRAARPRATAASRTRRSCGSPRANVSSPSGASSPRAARMPLMTLSTVERDADHAGRGDRDPVLGHAGRHRGGALHRARRPRARAGPWPRWRCRSWRRPRAARRAGSAPACTQHRRGEHARAGEARGAHRVRRRRRPAARGRSAPLGLRPQRHAGRAEAAGQPPARPRSRAPGGSTQRERRSSCGSSPSHSSSPNIRLRFWTACDAAPFQRLSIAAKTIMRPVRGSSCTEMRQ